MLIFACLCVSFAGFGCRAEKTGNVAGSSEQETAAANQTGNIAPNINAASVNAPANEDIPVPVYSDAAAAFNEGNKFFDANDNDKAIDAYKQAVKLNPELAEAYFRLGIAYEIREKEDEATADPEDTPTPAPTGKKNNGRKKVEVERKTNSGIAFENAVKDYKKITAKNPKDAAAFYNLGRAYGKLDEDDDAKKALQTAVKLEPENTEYQTEFGAILIKLAQYDEAVAALKKAIKIDDTNLVAQEMLEDAEAGKERVDFGANQMKKNVKDKDDK